MKIRFPRKAPLLLRDPAHRARGLRALRVAFAFLTVVPARFREGEVTEADVAASRYAFPVVGVAIGSVLAALSLALSSGRTAPMLASFLLVASWAVLTGGRHLDGLADSSDGLFLKDSPERRLVAMRAPHVGSFGILAMVLVVLGKTAALAPLPGRRRALAVLGAAAVGRTLILVASGLAPYARRDGTGRILVEATTVIDSLWSVVGILALGAILGGEVGLVAGVVALVVAWGLTHLAQQKLGGVTGDILGAIVELGELAYLVILGLLPPP